MNARKLERLIEEAVVDAYNESEERTGLYTMLDERLEVPFKTEGEKCDPDPDVQIFRGEWRRDDVCRAGRKRLNIPKSDCCSCRPIVAVVRNKAIGSFGLTTHCAAVA